MDRRFRKQEDTNCQCQCHFPSHIICHITHCCHCTGNQSNQNQGMSNNNSINFSPSYSNRNPYRKNEYVNTMILPTLNNQIVNSINKRCDSLWMEVGFRLVKKNERIVSDMR